MKNKWIVAALAACAIALAGCKVVSEPEPIAVESVTLNVTTLTLVLGAKEKLTATINPDNADDKTVVWLSSDFVVAMVGEDGTVTARKEGTANITAHAGGKTATCALTVKPIPIAVENVTLDETMLTLMRGETEKLTATVNPDNATDKTVTWLSSAPAVATVGEDGTVTAVSKGTATITAQAGGKRATCVVTVKQAVENITLDKATLTLAPDMTVTLTATVTPENADGTVTWSSSNDEIVAVDNDGTVTAHKVGKAIITAQANGKEATCEVTVHTDHSYSGGKCILCGATPYIENGTIDENGVLTKYTGSASTVAIPEGVTSIGENAFDNRYKLTSVTIPGSVTSIGDGAFRYCMSLTSVTIPGSVTSIGDSAFYYCKSLTSVEILEGVTSIGNSAFSNCFNLTSVTIPYSVTSIGEKAFEECHKLTSVTIPGSVTSIGNSAFCYCESLTSVEILEGVTSIGNSAFYKCTSLASVTIPDGVTSILYSAFHGCTGLTSVEIPDSVTSIASWAFEDCTSLASVTIPGNVTYIGRLAFCGCTNLTEVTYAGTKDEWRNIEKEYNIFIRTNVTEITDKDGVTFTVDKSGNITD